MPAATAAAGALINPTAHAHGAQWPSCNMTVSVTLAGVGDAMRKEHTSDAAAAVPYHWLLVAAVTLSHMQHIM